MAMAPLTLLLPARRLSLILGVESGVRAKREHSAECYCKDFVSHGIDFNSSSVAFLEPTPMRRVARGVFIPFTPTDETFWIQDAAGMNFN
jgi:hypothetical protein